MHPQNTKKYWIPNELCCAFSFTNENIHINENLNQINSNLMKYFLMNCALLIDYYIYIYENWMYQIKIFASILIFLFIIHASNDILFSTYFVIPLKYSSLAYQNILFTLCDPDSVLISHLYLPHFPILFAFYAFTSPKKYK